MSITFTTTIFAVLKLFLISLGGYIIVRRKVISEESLGDFSRIILYLTLPALVFVTMIDRFNLSLFKESIAIPIGMLIMTALAWLLAFASGRIFSAPKDDHFLLTAMVMFGNSWYLPIPLVMSILPKAKAEEAIVLISLVILVVSPALWSLGVYLVAHRPGIRIPLSQLITPPIVGIILGGVCALTPSAKGFLQNRGRFLLDSLSMIANATVPMVMILLGGVMGAIKVRGSLKWPFILRVAVLKLFILPAIVIPTLYFLPVPNMIKFMIALQSMVPPATNIIVIAKIYDRPVELISITMLVTYLISLVTIPLFLHITTLFIPLV